MSGLTLAIILESILVGLAGTKDSGKMTTKPVLPSVVRDKSGLAIGLALLVLGALATVEFKLTTWFVLAFGLLALFIFLPGIFLVCVVRITEDGLDYVRFRRVHHVPWPGIVSVRGVFWLPLTSIRLRGMTWPLCYIIAEDFKDHGLPTYSLRFSEGDTTRAIREHLLKR